MADAAASLTASPSISASAITALCSAALTSAPAVAATGTVPPINPEGAEILRVYKHGASTYTEITSADDGGYSTLTWTRVRNAPGSLDITLEGTTIEQLHTWIDAVARVELWVNQERVGIFTVDEYTPKWSALTCTVSCVGVLANARTAYYTGTFPAGATGASVLAALVGVVHGITVGDLSGVSATLGAISYTDTVVFDAIADICQRLGADFFVDGDGRFCTAATATTPTRTFTLGTDAYEFDTTYNARDVVNRIVLSCDGRSWTFDDATSQAAYGVRARSVGVTGIVAQADAQAWADAMFAEYAQPFRQMGVLVSHDWTLAPGLMVAIDNVETGGVYEGLINQITWTVGALDDSLQVGTLPLTIDPPVGVSPPDVIASIRRVRGHTDIDFDNNKGILTTDAEGNPEWKDAGDLVNETLTVEIPGADAGDVLTVDENGNLTWVPSESVGGTGLTKGVLTAYDSGTSTATFQPDGGGSTWTVAVPEHITSPTLNRTCWVAGSAT